MYTLVGARASRSMRVLWLLEELGVDYDHLPHKPLSDEVKALNPSGKVPVLIEDGQVFTDSTAIMTYLADKHGRFTFPAGTPERAHQDAHTQFLLDEFDACLWTAARHTFVLPEDLRLREIKTSLKWEFARAQKRLVERLDGKPFLMGETFTIADIIAGHCGGWARSAKFPEGDAAYEAYVDRLRARPAFVRARGE